MYASIYGREWCVSCGKGKSMAHESFWFWEEITKRHKESIQDKDVFLRIHFHAEKFRLYVGDFVCIFCEYQ